MWSYKPTRFMASDCHYDKEKADRAVYFISNLKHGDGEFAGQPFGLLNWQEQIVRDIFGVIGADGYRQFRTAYIEIPKKNGKSELAAAVALYMLIADGEQSAEVYSCAGDREQAKIVFDVAKRMAEQSPALMKRLKIVDSTHRMIYPEKRGKYVVLSADAVTKYGFKVSCCIFDEQR
jgi:phage terminase large subunit-like protein